MFLFSLCSLSWDQLVQYNEENLQTTLAEDDLATYCFRAAYVYQMLHNGYGFNDDDHIISTDVVQGHKLGWALGSILYEINTLPWEYVEAHGQHHINAKKSETMFHDWGMDFSRFLLGIVFVALLGLLQILRLHRKKSSHGWKEGYEAVFDANDIEIEKLARSCPDFQVQNLPRV